MRLYPQSLRALINEDSESLEMEENENITFVFFRLELIICYYLVNKAHRPKLLSFFLSRGIKELGIPSQHPHRRQLVGWWKRSLGTDLLLEIRSHRVCLDHAAPESNTPDTEVML